MRKTKQKKLAARGWAVGSTVAFLGLSAAEAALVELKLALSTGLRARPVRRARAWLRRN